MKRTNAIHLCHLLKKKLTCRLAFTILSNRGTYVGIHSAGFKDFLLKAELLRAIQVSPFCSYTMLRTKRMLKYSIKRAMELLTYSELI